MVLRSVSRERDDDGVIHGRRPKPNELSADALSGGIVIGDHMNLSRERVLEKRA